MSIQKTTLHPENDNTIDVYPKTSADQIDGSIENFIFSIDNTDVSNPRLKLNIRLGNMTAVADIPLSELKTSESSEGSGAIDSFNFYLDNSQIEGTGISINIETDTEDVFTRTVRIWEILYGDIIQLSDVVTTPDSFSGTVTGSASRARIKGVLPIMANMGTYGGRIYYPIDVDYSDSYPDITHYLTFVRAGGTTTVLDLFVNRRTYRVSNVFSNVV